MIASSELMRLAIAKAREGIATGQSPFGCAIARGDDVVAVAHNVVLATPDITAHAEITALREACRRLKCVHLIDCIVATTCEPCPMCMSALHWARVDSVHFGATIADAAAAGFNELNLAAIDLLRLGGSSVRLVSGVLADDCRQLFQEFNARPGHTVY
jgi:tRNA(Arg) A34 adenosine deaminase TadA